MKLALTIISVVIITVGLISIASNFFIKDEFKNYILKVQDNKTYGMVDEISKVYNKEDKSFNIDAVHSIGMNALYDGYIIKVFDSENNSIWDAEQCDGTTCAKVMDDITFNMKANYPKIDGKFTEVRKEVAVNGEIIGWVEINYYGPFFLNEEDFNFLKTLNEILLVVGGGALIFSIIIAIVMARKISDPINRTVESAKQISYGEYNYRIDENTNTKEIKELIFAINNLADSLEKQENIRKQLTADIAHEFRTPLTTLQTHMEAMIEGIWEMDVCRLESCHDEIIRISKMVKDLENLARVEGDNLKLNKSEISLLLIVEKVIGNFEKEIEKKELVIDIKADDIKILADGDRITQVVINLISNAIKYTNNGGMIKINIFEEESYIGLRVEDNGIGISKEELPLIFERFYRTDKSRNHATGGSGIGLTIVKSIILAHNGEVEVNSKLNKGSIFTVKLPKFILKI